MKLRKKIICSVVMLSLLIGLAILFLCPQIIATRYGYFDASNGKSKVECVSLGRIYQQSVQETEYSKLLIKFGFPETSPDWKLATQEEMFTRGHGLVRIGVDPAAVRLLSWGAFRAT